MDVSPFSQAALAQAIRDADAAIDGVLVEMARLRTQLHGNTAPPPVGVDHLVALQPRLGCLQGLLSSHLRLRAAALQVRREQEMEPVERRDW